MVGEGANFTFDGVSEVLGAEVFLTDGTTERLDKEQLEEQLFHSESEKVTASAGQLLGGYFQQTGTSPSDYVNRQTMLQALESGEAVTTASLEVRFGGGAIKFKRREELVDPDRVSFEVRITVRPSSNA